MGIELSGDVLGRLFYLGQLCVLAVAAPVVAVAVDDPAGSILALLFAVFAVAVAAALVFRTDEDAASGLPRGDDITVDPFGDPGQAAKERWARAVERLSDDGED